MALQLIIAGGGIGGLAAALAVARVGHAVTVHEQSAAFSEAGAGIQLGPNVTRVLRSWGLDAPLDAIAARPDRLIVRRAEDNEELASMQLRGTLEQRYGAPYLTVHRADLQVLLLGAAVGAGVETRTGSRLVGVANSGQRVSACAAGGTPIDADALIAADGIWSKLRTFVDGADPSSARSTGHVAFRGLVSQSVLPESCRSSDVNVWLGPQMHVVAYPVRGGDWLNMVVLVEASPPADSTDWDSAATADQLRACIGRVAPGVRERIEAMPSWRLWTLHDRPPLRGAQQMAHGRVALLGDAAHPMLPYLAQGAGMAIEDAQVLAAMLVDAVPASVPQALQRYAQARWRRCAQVQSKARRNATLFHASGLMRLGRDIAMKAMGSRLIDQPWLYGRAA